MEKYKAKLWLSKYKYLAILENALAIVTCDDNGNEIRWVIFGGNHDDQRDTCPDRPQPKPIR